MFLAYDSGCLSVLMNFLSPLCETLGFTFEFSLLFSSLTALFASFSTIYHYLSQIYLPTASSISLGPTYPNPFSSMAYMPRRSVALSTRGHWVALNCFRKSRTRLLDKRCCSRSSKEAPFLSWDIYCALKI